MADPITAGLGFAAVNETVTLANSIIREIEWVKNDEYRRYQFYTKQKALYDSWLVERNKVRDILARVVQRYAQEVIDAREGNRLMNDPNAYDDREQGAEEYRNAHDYALPGLVTAVHDLAQQYQSRGFDMGV
jgi:hypothetical protein